ncbi:MAG: GNAT family N-acetyltransferase [Candidatus Aquicultorales bacterium]
MDITLKEDKVFSQEDVEQLIELYQELRWTKERKPSDISEMLVNCTLVVSLWDGRRLVGFARVLSDMVYRATIWDVVVRPEYRGRGLGTRLMRHILEHPRLSRVERFWLVTRGCEFYERLGFRRDDESMIFERSASRQRGAE